MKDFNLAFSVVKTGRSLAASYNLQNDIQRKRPMRCAIHYFMASSVRSGSIGPRSETVRITSIHNLHIDQRLQERESRQGHQRCPRWVWFGDHHAHCGHARPGAGKRALVDSVSPSLKLRQGFIDFDVEIAKCEKKLNLTRLNLEKIRKFESQPEYEETVPANVRLINEDKVWQKDRLQFYRF